MSPEQQQMIQMMIPQFAQAPQKELKPFVVDFSQIIGELAGRAYAIDNSEYNSEIKEIRSILTSGSSSEEILRSIRITAKSCFVWISDENFRELVMNSVFDSQTLAENCGAPPAP